jgi:transposase
MAGALFMIRFSESIRVYVSFARIDFRRGLDGLLALIQETFGHEAQENYLFIFCDASRKKIKVVWWDRNGFMRLYKRLEAGKFQFPKIRSGKIQLNRLQFECLLSGMNFIDTNANKVNEYSVFS